MANAVDRTGHAGLIPTLWEPQLEYVAQQPRGVAEAFWDVSDKVQGPGNTYKINILPALTVTAGFASGDLRTWAVGGSVNYNGGLTPFTVSLALSLKAVGIAIEPDVEDFSVTKLADAYLPVMAEAIYQGIDIDILNLYSEFASGDNVGSSTANWTIADFLLGLQRLRKNAKDKLKDGDDVMGFYCIGQLDKILSFSDVVNASVRGERVGAAVDGVLRTVYGVKIKLTENIVSSTGRRNLIAAKKAIVWGKKYPAKIETDRVDLVEKVIAYCNWGCKSAHSNTTYSGTGKDLAVQHLTA